MIFLLVAAILAESLAVDVPIKSHWNGGFNGKACIGITKELHSWTGLLKFDQPIDSLETWVATATKSADGKEFTLTNKDWNKDEHIGDQLCIEFVAHTSSDINPKATFEIQGMVSGSVTGVTTGSVTSGTGTQGTVVTYPQTLPPIPTRAGSRLTVNGTDLVMNGEKVFLSGVNQAWIAYGYDFGDNNYEYRHVEFEKYLKMVYDNGGNSIRVWVHIEGAVTPNFDATGHVISLDKKGTFISDIRKYLRKALEYNILIFFCLWNGALTQTPHFHLDGLIKDTSKLQSYLDNALIPWVKAVKDEPAMGGWDIINEMEGEITPDLTSTEPCFDTKFLHGSGAGWAGRLYSSQEFLRFINMQVDAIRQTDPQALVTAGSWNAKSNVDKWGGFNLYKDECLVKAGGKKMGTLTFYSSHTYAWGGKYDDLSPFKHTFADYGLNKPLVVAEFNSVSSGGMDIVDQFKYLYTKGYAGGWTWHAHADGANTDSTATQMRGLLSLKGKNDQTQGGRVPLTL